MRSRVGNSRASRQRRLGRLLELLVSSDARMVEYVVAERAATQTEAIAHRGASQSTSAEERGARIVTAHPHATLGQVTG